MNIIQAQALYRRSIKPCLFMLEPEFAHGLSHFGIKLVESLIASNLIKRGELSNKFAQSFLGTNIDYPVGLAAGFDKNAKLLNHISCLGFGFSEVGSITCHASRGNPKPRLFRLPEDQAIINFMGLNGDGASVVSRRLKDIDSSFPVAVNIAKTNDATIIGDKAIEDIVESFKAISSVKVAYIAINVSCPNTHDDIKETGKQLEEILSEVKKVNILNTPLFLKVSPDSDDRLLNEILSAASSGQVSGYICGNTTVNRDGLKTSRDLLSTIGRGGLSGRPLKERALNIVQKVNKLKKPEQKIIACGGIFSGQDAFDFIASGASLLEIYTALIYRGPFAPIEILKELEVILDREGIEFKEAIGSRLKVEF